MNEFIKGIEDTILEMKQSLHDKLKKTKDELTQ